MKPRLVKDQDTHWIPAVSFERVIVHSGRTLGLFVREVKGEWLAAALETKSYVQNTMEAVEAVFDDHAHEVLGSHAHQRAAQDACDRYAKKWLANREKAARCECKTIQPQRVRSTSSTTRRVRSTSPVSRRADPEAVRKALGAEKAPRGKSPAFARTKRGRS